MKRTEAHGPLSATGCVMDPSEQPRKRARPALSCTDCKRRKIKCDRATICNNCVKSGAICVYDAFLRDDRPARYDRQYLNRPPRQDSTNCSVTTNPGGSHELQNDLRINSRATEVQEPPTGVSSTSICQVRQALETTPNDLDIVQRIESLENIHSNQKKSDLPSQLPLPQSRTQTSELIFTKTRISRWSDWMGISTQFSPTYACYTEALGMSNHAAWQEPNVRRLTLQMGELLRSCKIVSQSRKSRQTNPLSINDDQNMLLPDQDRTMAYTMTRLYFSHFESTYRILHIPTFWRECEEYWSHKSATTTAIRLKVCLVIAIGSVMHESDSSFRNMARQWIYTAERWLADPIEKQKLNVCMIQIHCLVILARQLLSVSGDFIWTSMGTLVNRAMQIGLHRDPKHLPKMTILQAELRRRLWVTILEMVVQSSLDSAMPPRILLADFDCSPPSNLDDDAIDNDTVMLVSCPENTFTSTSIQLKLYSSLVTRLRILQVLTDLHNDLKYEEVLRLSSQLLEACAELRSFSDSHKQHGLTQFHQNILIFMVHRFMIPLHCPFVRKATQNPLFIYSINASLDASIAIVSPQKDTSYSQLMAVGSSFCKEAIRLSATIISLELLSQINEQRHIGTIHCNVQSREHLKQGLRNTIDMALARLRNGESNVKSHLFLSMILAQAEAVEFNRPVELEVAKRGLESIRLCYDILRTRATIGIDDLLCVSPDDDFGFGMDLEYAGDFQF